jgi:hypothetical protein
MASGSAQPPSQKPARDAPGADANRRSDAAATGEERVGPLAILRCQKSDGRALLLYSRVEHDVAANSEPARGAA